MYHCWLFNIFVIYALHHNIIYHMANNLVLRIIQQECVWHEATFVKENRHKKLHYYLT